MENTQILLFLGTVFLICITPGPDLLYVMANGISKGVKGGLVASLGMASGMVFHTIIVVTGLSFLITSSVTVFTIVQVAGALYLIYIGYHSLKDSNESLEFKNDQTEGLWLVYKNALITNILNPKVSIFFLSFLPQFVQQDAGDSQQQLLILSLLFLAVGLFVDSSVGILSGKVRLLLTENLKLHKRLNVFAALIFFGLWLFEITSLILNNI